MMLRNSDMNSIARHIDEHDIAQEVRFTRRVHRGSFLLLEGITDINRFADFVDAAECDVVNCYGRRNAILAIKILYDEGFLGAVCVVDADFDRILDRLEEHEGIIYSEGHDFDLDWIHPTILSRYLRETGDQAKCSAFRSMEDLVVKIMLGLKPVSVARLLNRKRQIEYKVSHIDISDIYNNFEIDLDSYVNLIVGSSAPGKTRSAVKDLIEKNTLLEYNLYQLTNGHDFHCALGACLRVELGSRKAQQTWGREVAKHLRLGFREQEFQDCTVYRKICEWENENSPYRILKAHLKSEVHSSIRVKLGAAR